MKSSKFCSIYEQEKADSKHRIEDVCKLIQDSLSDMDLENTRWHWWCHQFFTMNLNRLQSESQGTLENAQRSWSGSVWKRRSEEGNKFVFPHDICLFWNKKTTTSGGKMFKSTETFTSWGHKKFGRTNIKQMASDLQNDRYSGLLRKLPGVDFAAEAHFHDPATQTFIVSVKHGKVIRGHQIQMKCLQHTSLHTNPWNPLYKKKW